MNAGRTYFRFVTNHAFDRQTDGRADRILIAIPRLHSMQRGKKVKNRHPG